MVSLVLKDARRGNLSTSVITVPGGNRIPLLVSGRSGYPVKTTVQGSLDADALNSIPTLSGRRAKGTLSLIRWREGHPVFCMDLDWIQDRWATKDFDMAGSGGRFHRSIEVSHGDVHPVGTILLSSDPVHVGYPVQMRSNGVPVSWPFFQASVLPQ